MNYSGTGRSWEMAASSCDGPAGMLATSLFSTNQQITNPGIRPGLSRQGLSEVLIRV